LFPGESEPFLQNYFPRLDLIYDGRQGSDTPRLKSSTFHNQDSTREMNRKEMYEKIRLLTCIISQDIMFFLIHKILLCILYCRDNFYNFPLKNVDEKSPCTLEQQSSNSIEDHHTTKENPKIKTNHPIPVHILVPNKVPDRYKPLILPPTLNPFPKDHPQYLPRFDGENGVTAQKHIQVFEDYLNIKWMMRMFVLGFSLFLCKAKLGLGSKPCLKQASQILSSFSNSSLIDG